MARRNWLRLRPAPTLRCRGSRRVPASTTRVTATRSTSRAGRGEHQGQRVHGEAGVHARGRAPTPSSCAAAGRARGTAPRAPGVGKASSSQVVTTFMPRCDRGPATWGLTALSEDEVQSDGHVGPRLAEEACRGRPSTLTRILRGSPSTAPRSLPAWSGERSAAPTTCRPSVSSTRRAMPWPMGPRPSGRP